MIGTPTGPHDVESPDDRSGHAHRQLIGYLGFALPFILVTLQATRATEQMGRWPPQDSISAYYYSGATAAFVGLLIALALCLFTYRGYDNDSLSKDRWTACIAGFAAVGVAMFPTEAPSKPLAAGWWSQWMGVAHYSSAVVLFCSFIVFALVLFRKSAPGIVLPPDKRMRNHVYLLCGMIMVIAVISCGVFGAIKAPIFVPESIALLAFSFSWLTKGQAHKTLARVFRRTGKTAGAAAGEAAASPAVTGAGEKLSTTAPPRPGD